MIIRPASKMTAAIDLPGDKSISHRAALFTAMADGISTVANFASSEDCGSTLSCLLSLGVKIERTDTALVVHGVGKNGFVAPAQPLDCGNSGTTVRLLSGILAGQNFDSVLTGDQSLSARPMKRVIEPLSLMNVSITSTNDRLPMTIEGKTRLSPINYELPVASAQVKSCVLLAGLNAEGKTTVQSPESKLPVANSRDHTELMLRHLGAEIDEEFVETENGFIHKVSISGDSRLSARDIVVPSDISSAAFFMVAAACLKGSDLLIRNVGLNPTRTAVINVLKDFGAAIEIQNIRENCGEIIGDIRVKGARSFVSNGVSHIIGGDIIPNLIDEIPILAVFGTQLPHGLEIRDAEELRVKESDRIAAVVGNLKRMGADVEEFPDGFRVGRSNLKGAGIDSFGDHRIAMAFSIAGLFAEGETEIAGSECAAVSFPEFYKVLEKILER